MEPVRCLSSHITSLVLSYRNPPNLPIHSFFERVENTTPVENEFYITFRKKIIIELTISVLIVAGIIETIAYLTLTTPAVIVAPFLGMKLFNKNYKLLENSAFSVFWNIANLFFNFSCDLIPQHESIARIAMLHSRKGKSFCTELRRYALFASTLRLINVLPKNNFLLNEFLLFYRLFNDHLFDSVREEDSRYFEEHYPTHQAVFLNSESLEKKTLLSYFKAQGILFLKEFIFDKLTHTDRLIIAEEDPDAFNFVAIRSIYLFVLGEKKEESIPLFFEKETIGKIEELRKKYRYFSSHLTKEEVFNILSEKVENLEKIKSLHQRFESISALLDKTEKILTDYKAFSSYEASNISRIDFIGLENIMKDLRNVAVPEVTKPFLLFKKCWGPALEMSLNSV